MEVSRGRGAKSEKTRFCTPAEGGISFLQDGIFIPSQGEAPAGMNLGFDTPGGSCGPVADSNAFGSCRPSQGIWDLSLEILRFEIDIEI